MNEIKLICLYFSMNQVSATQPPIQKDNYNTITTSSKCNFESPFLSICYGKVFIDIRGGLRRHAFADPVNGNISSKFDQ